MIDSLSQRTADDLMRCVTRSLEPPSERVLAETARAILDQAPSLALLGCRIPLEATANPQSVDLLFLAEQHRRSLLVALAPPVESCTDEVFRQFVDWKMCVVDRWTTPEFTALGLVLDPCRTSVNWGKGALLVRRLPPRCLHDSDWCAAGR